MKRLAIIGFGHIGASIAGALQNESVPTEVLAIDRNPEVLLTTIWVACARY